MSGGKETGRQKMIGMMYLVLTALLAMNVSNTVIDKFVFLNDSLVQANNETAQRNMELVEGIKKAVSESGSRPNDVQIMEAAEKIRSEAARVMKEIDVLKDTLVMITGGYLDGKEGNYMGDAKNLVGKTDYDKLGNWMMPTEEGGKGNGSELKQLLNGFAETVKTTMKANGAEESELVHYKPIALDADDDPLYNQDPNQKGKKFSTVAFDAAPTPAGLATLAEFQSRLLGYETRALSTLASAVGAEDMKFDRIVPMVLPESKYVAAGTKYTARMFIAASSSGVTPTMKYNETDIPVDASGQGIVEFTASASDYDENLQARKSFTAAISVTMPGGRDTTFTDQIEYFVVKPVMQIQSQSVSALYLNCGNNMNVLVPALGTTYNPAFSATNGRTFKGADKGQVTIVPNSKNDVTLTVSSNGSEVGSRTFKVKNIPAPEITAFLGPNKPVDLKNGIPSRTSRIYLKPVPDQSFLDFLPDDARFKIVEAEVTLVSGGLARSSIKTGENVNLGPLMGQARKGDQINIEIKRVERMNFKGEKENFTNFQRYINISVSQ
ncbi:MAG: gliding motility protein GldM [Cyclobacteriaceae bacterium]